ncbi:rCG24840 [Rattus norvegicus]|uniref:RCG24840 n=1 Tax=Rattus norvegicus TaxID=10116 RepID=A6JBM0_RAT|nr:rCG24840 [Rattus norvegicus]
MCWPCLLYTGTGGSLAPRLRLVPCGNV